MKTLLITGCGGLVGTAAKKLFITKNYKTVCVHRKHYDLRDENMVKQMLKDINPHYIVNCAATVGGVKFNNEHPEILYRDNILINTHLIHHAHEHKVEKLVSFSSACAFMDGNYPFKEDNLQEGKPYVGNLAYGYAKRMIDIQNQIYNKAYGRNYLALIPVSLYGKNDQFSLENGHFIASLIHKTYLAKENKQPLTLWGDGSPLRELLFADDLARVIFELLEKEVSYDKFMITSGEEVSIKTAAETIAEIMGFTGEIIWDTTKPKGQYRKPADPSRLKEVLPEFQFTPYKQGIKETVDWFVEEIEHVWGYVRR